MNIAVCFKSVPVVAPDPSAGPGALAAMAYEVNETDLCALVEGLTLRDAHGGTVTAITVGPAYGSADVILTPFALGVDRTMHVQSDEPVDGATAAAAVAKLGGEYDLILAGIQASDDVNGFFGPAVGELMGIPSITGVIEIDVEDTGSLRVTRELTGGGTQVTRLPMPCVLAVQLGIQPVPFVSVMGRLQAKKRKPDPVDLKELIGESPLSTSPHMVSLSAPATLGQCRFIEGDSTAAAADLFHELELAGFVSGAK